MFQPFSWPDSFFPCFSKIFHTRRSTRNDASKPFNSYPHAESPNSPLIIEIIFGSQSLEDGMMTLKFPNCGSYQLTYLPKIEPSLNGYYPLRYVSNIHDD